MGLDIRHISISALDGLPAHLRDRGFDITITQKPNPAPAGGTLTEVYCRRGRDIQLLVWASFDFAPGIKRVYIANQGGWLPWVRRRRCLLQSDVTSAIEELGGHWPYPD